MIQYKMTISLVSFVIVSFCLGWTISAKSGLLSRRYGEPNQSSMPSYPLSYAVIQGVFDQDGMWEIRSGIILKHYI